MAANVTVLHLDYDQTHHDRDRHFALTFNPKAEAIIEAVNEGLYKKVATVHRIDLDDAFRYTNHIDCSWTENSCVTAEPGRHRSTSVGDIMIAQDTEGKKRMYVVASFGFDELHNVAVPA
jgi:hypothetical protein